METWTLINGDGFQIAHCNEFWLDQWQMFVKKGNFVTIQSVVEIKKLFV